MKRAVNGRMLSPKWVIESEPSTKRGRERVRERGRERVRERVRVRERGRETDHYV
jgi:hypothetical protein